MGIIGRVAPIAVDELFAPTLWNVPPVAAPVATPWTGPGSNPNLPSIMAIVGRAAPEVVDELLDLQKEGWVKKEGPNKHESKKEEPCKEHSPFQVFCY
jgi:hypothetical protein